VVSTRIGIEGLPVRDGDNVVLADSPEDFAAAVARLLKDKAERDRIGQNARAYVESNVSWGRAADAFADGLADTGDDAAGVTSPSFAKFEIDPEFLNRDR